MDSLPSAESACLEVSMSHTQLAGAKENCLGIPGASRVPENRCIISNNYDVATDGAVLLGGNGEIAYLRGRNRLAGTGPLIKFCH